MTGPQDLRSYELLSDGEREDDGLVKYGRPCRKPWVSWKDALAIALVYGCCMVSLTAVFYQPAAVWLGQTSQLVVVGAIISIMAFGMKSQVRSALMLLEARFGSSTLQSYDALLRMNWLGSRIGFLLRSALLLVVALPVGLGILYKQFSWGQSSVPLGINKLPPFGLYPGPGLSQDAEDRSILGNGLASAMNAYIQYWYNVSQDGVYGYNLYIPENGTAALLDTPSTDWIQVQFDSLPPGMSIRVSATVNATQATALEVSRHDDILDPDGNLVTNSRFYKNQTLDLSWNPNTNESALCSAMFVPQLGSRYVYASIYECPRPTSGQGGWFPDLFQQNYRGYNLSRQCYYGEWNITDNDVKLLDAKRALGDCGNQTLIQSGWAEMDWMFPMLPEFNWIWGMPFYTLDEPVDTLAPLVATGAWARITALLGPSGSFSTLFPELTTYTVDAQFTKYAFTLQRSGRLAIVLLLEPLIMTACLIVRMIFHQVPIGEGFGLISFLSAVRYDAKKLDMLDGAGLSGELERPIRARIDAMLPSQKKPNGFISILLNGTGHPRPMQRGIRYG